MDEIAVPLEGLTPAVDEEAEYKSDIVGLLLCEEDRMVVMGTGAAEFFVGGVSCDAVGGSMSSAS